ncbi:hypothetical protein, partial [Serratia marcescens]|uniref:hypothetical protein n=1 Tax=Serratia marcescens TaxID=615 RepID=UPI0013DCAE55
GSFVEFRICKLMTVPVVSAIVADVSNTLSAPGFPMTTTGVPQPEAETFGGVGISPEIDLYATPVTP